MVEHRDVMTDGKEETVSKKALKKQAKEAEKAAKKEARKALNVGVCSSILG